jgi:hypothetical protein
MEHMLDTRDEQSGIDFDIQEHCFMRNFIRCISRIFITQLTIFIVFLPPKVLVAEPFFYFVLAFM